MNFIKFEEKEFTEEILVKAGDFEVVCFEGNRNDRIQISAWEVDGELFDILLLGESDILDDTFHDEHADLSQTSCNDFRDTYTFDIKNTRCLVISNVRAITRDKLVRLHLTRITPEDLLNNQRETIQERSSRPPLKSNNSVLSTRAKLTGSILLILTIMCVIVYALTGNAVAGSIAAILAALMIAVFKDVIAKKIGLVD